MQKQHWLYLTVTVALFIGLMIIIDITRPAIPVDETRYITVAWEFMARDAWILPTLNFEPYHHKPPMLFWLIRAAWDLTGEPSLWAARLVPMLAALITLLLTYRLGRALWPDDHGRPIVATLMMATTPFFMIYSSLLMFDTLMTVAVLMGALAVVRFYQTGHRRHFLGLGAALGLGILIKGPVILVYLLPLALVWPLVHKPTRPAWSTWFQGLIMAVALGATIALAWAIPAAHLGGPDYERMIFWGQSAGRMTHSFDHAHPFWLYAALLPLMVLPWGFVPALWRRGVRDAGTPLPFTHDPARSMVGVWLITVFVIFSAISGKQAHYLLPMLPAFFLFLAHHLHQRQLLNHYPPARLFLWATLPFILVLTAMAGLEFYARHWGFELTQDLITQLDSTIVWPLLVGLAIVAALGLGIHYARCTIPLPATLLAVVAAHAIMIGALHLSIAPMLKTYYDLTPAAQALRPLLDEQRPVMVANVWHGELGFLARQDYAWVEQPAGDVAAWLRRYRNGVVIIRHDADWAPPRGARFHYTQAYRSPDRRLSIVVRK